jgi:hypothetical protein
MGGHGSASPPLSWAGELSNSTATCMPIGANLADRGDLLPKGPAFQSHASIGCRELEDAAELALSR